MKRITKNLSIGLIALFFLTTTHCQAQTPKAEILTNKNIVEITKAGLGNNIILSKINSSTCKFDVSTTALINLKKQGVPEPVIRAMIGKTNGNATVDQPAPPVQQAKASNLPVISQLNYVHYNDNGKAIPLEKPMSKINNKKIGLGGFGGSEMRLEIDGATSAVKIAQAMVESFVINTGGNLPDIVLFKLKGDKSKRYAVVGKLTPTGPKSGDDMLPIEFTKLSDGMYGIKTGNKLDKGEYYFTSKPSINLSTSASDVYAFAIQ